MSEQTFPILYSFRRCPYAMRARMALTLNQVSVEIRELILKNKPAEMLLASPKGTVPVLIANNGQIIEESLEVMDYAVTHGTHSILKAPTSAELTLIAENDDVFKANLDKYKYFDRFPQQTQQDYRAHGEVFLRQLEQRLAIQDFLFGHNQSYGDIAIFPFVRQFAHVDKAWFDGADYPHLKKWLDNFLQSSAFLNVMKKIPCWQTGDAPTYFPFSEE
ncbi:glutathione S-transferase [Psychrobium sp. nBUS_13]|uniref:glutathione S-transferase n=1 Tax=Psychrobium sp. nBUS_13 TaxID=3395319 RepID=UPI003EB71D88